MTSALQLRRLDLRPLSLLGLPLVAGVAFAAAPAATAPAADAPAGASSKQETPAGKSPTQEPEPDAPPAARGVEFVPLTLADARSRAENEQRLLLVFWTSDNSPECARMRATTFRDALLGDWVARNAIAVMVNGPQDVASVAAHKVRIYPCVDLIDPVLGARVERLEGETTADDLLGSFSGALVGGGPAPKPEGAAIEDPFAWLAYANSTWRNGEGDPHEAARAYGWVLRHGDQYRPGFRARYFEFLLRRLAYLKPAAREALDVLRAERAAVAGRLAGDVIEPRDVYELVRLDWWLRAVHETRATYQMLAGRGESAERARQLLFRHVVDDLGRRELFDDLLAGLGETSPAAYLRDRLAAIDANVARQAAGERLREEELDSRADAVLAATWIYEALLAAGRGKDAAELVDAIAELTPTGRAFALLVERAMRRNLPELAIRVGTRGLPLVAGQQGERQLKRALAKVPGYVPPPDSGDDGEGADEDGEGADEDGG